MFSGGHLGFKFTEVTGIGVRNPLPTPLGRIYTLWLPQVTLKIETKMATCYISTIIRNRGLQTVYLLGKVDESKRLGMELKNTYTKQRFKSDQLLSPFYRSRGRLGVFYLQEKSSVNSAHVKFSLPSICLRIILFNHNQGNTFGTLLWQNGKLSTVTFPPSFNLRVLIWRCVFLKIERLRFRFTRNG